MYFNKIIAVKFNQFLSLFKYLMCLFVACDRSNRKKGHGIAISRIFEKNNKVKWNSVFQFDCCFSSFSFTLISMWFAIFFISFVRLFHFIYVVVIRWSETKTTTSTSIKTICWMHDTRSNKTFNFEAIALFIIIFF